MQKFVTLGDAHLWPVMWQRLPEARGDSFVAARQVFEYAIEHELPVICSGDILNYGQKGGVADCLAFLRDLLPKLKQFLFIVGNHDLSGHTHGVLNCPWLDAFENMPNVQHLSTTPIEYAGQKIVGIDYCQGRDALLEKLQAAKKAEPDILILHQGLKEILSYENAWSVQAAELADIARISIVGHTHVEWAKNVRDDRWVISPGSTIPWHFDEEHDKTFPVIGIGDDRAIDVEIVPIEKRRQIFTAVCTTPEEKEKALQIVRSYEKQEDLPSEITRPILRLRYTADPSFYEKIVEESRNKFHLDLTVERLRKDKPKEEPDEDQKEDIDEVAAATEKHTDPGLVRDAALQIQYANDPAVIDTYVSRILD